MSLGKHNSVTSDTKATRSFHQSLAGHQKLAQQLMQSEQSQIQFLRRKNAQLQQRVSKIMQHVSELEANKIQLLALNQKYVLVINEYYRRIAPGKENKSGVNEKSLLEGLEKDHRNLVKHCLVMEKQIKNYIKEMDKFNEMKSHLHSVNHSSTKELIEELRSLSEENKQLKMDNNRLQFDLQKSKKECSRLKKGKQEWQDKADLDGDELERYKSLVNNVQQECADKSSNYEAKIYELEIKVEKLQKQLREGQQYWLKTKDLKRRLQIASVEHVHEKDYFRMTIKDKKSLNLRQKRLNSTVKNSLSFCQ